MVWHGCGKPAANGGQARVGTFPPRSGAAFGRYNWRARRATDPIYWICSASPGLELPCGRVAIVDGKLSSVRSFLGGNKASFLIAALTNLSRLTEGVTTAIELSQFVGRERLCRA